MSREPYDPVTHQIDILGGIEGQLGRIADALQPDPPEIMLVSAPHDHETTWCPRCVEHGIAEQIERQNEETDVEDAP